MPSSKSLSSNPNLDEVYKEISGILTSSEAKLEARIILETILNITDFIKYSDRIVTKNELSKIFDVVDARNDKKTPLAYLLEEARFLDLKLFVNRDVLIPRPETELLVERVLEEIKTRKIHQPTILDLCTGSGCIAIALKRALPAAKVYASDISRAALNIASINAQRYNCDIHFVMGDYLDPFIEENLSKSPLRLPVMFGEPPYFDVIVTNPPYVSEADYANLEAELYHEPKHALVGFPYADIKRQAKELIHKGGFLAAEYGLGQSSRIKEIFPKAEIFKDYAGIDRIFVANADNNFESEI